MTKEQITKVRWGAMLFAYGFADEELQNRLGISARTLKRWQASFVWNEALDFIGFDGVRDRQKVRTGFGQWGSEVKDE